MINSNLHIINKVVLEVNTNSIEKGYYFKDNIDVFLKNELFPILETYFDSLTTSNPEQSIQIEKLDIDFSIDSNMDFEELKKQIIKNVSLQMSDKIHNNFSAYNRIEKDKKSLENVLYFIETGTNPWWNIAEIIFDNAFEKELTNPTIDAATIARFLSIFKNPVQRIRLIKQCSNHQIALISTAVFTQNFNNDKMDVAATIHKIKTITENKVLYNFPSLLQRNLIWELTLLSLVQNDAFSNKIKLFTLIYSFLNRKMDELEKKFISSAIRSIIESKSTLDILIELDKCIFELEKKLDSNKKQSENTRISTLDKKKEKSTTDDYFSFLEETKDQNKLEICPSIFEIENIKIEKKSNYYINNAGLLLVHPFLKQLFENCKLLHKDNSLKEPEVAASLLHFIATGQEQEYEHKMIVEKFICNIPISYPIDRNNILTAEMKKEAEEMIKAVLENWTVMKKSSVELLQNEFLKRPGKLILNETENPRIIIERKTQDILLDSLPWNLSIIKLPWIKKIIYVEW